MNSKTSPAVVADVRCELGEGPVWVVAEQALYFVDIEKNRVYRKGEKKLESFDFPVQITCVLPTISGRLLLVSSDNLHYWSPGKALGPGLITPRFDSALVRHNDCAVDPDGGILVGEMDRNGVKPIASLRHYRPDGTATVLMSGLTISNGIGFSPDARCMYHVDSPTGIIYKRSYSEGVFGEKEIYLKYDPSLGSTPDGLSVDSEGNVWICLWGGNRIDAWSPKGKILRSISIPAQNVTSCCFGGENLKTLFVTTAAGGESSEAGKVFSLRTGSKGLPQPLAEDLWKHSHGL